MLTEALRSLTVEYHNYPDVFPVVEDDRLDAVLPDSKTELRRELDAWVGESPFSIFTADRLLAELGELPRDFDAPKVPLSEIAGYSDLEHTAVRLVDQFNSLPWDYELYVRIPHDVGLLLEAGLGGQFALTDSMEFIAGTRIPEAEGSELHEVLAQRLGFESAKIFESAFYLRYTVQGYVGHLLTTTPLERLDSDLRAILGLLLAYKLVRTNAIVLDGSASGQRDCAQERRRAPARAATARTGGAPRGNSLPSGSGEVAWQT